MLFEIKGVEVEIEGWRWRLRGCSLRLRCSLGLRGGG